MFVRSMASATKAIKPPVQLFGVDGTYATALYRASVEDSKSIYTKFGQLNDAEQGIVEATITSAKPLDSKILKRLQTAITKSSFVGDGKTLKVANEVNPEILGGLVVEVGDKTVDLSISLKVAKLNATLSEAL